MRGRGHRQRKRQRPRLVQHDPQILDEDVDRRQRRVVPRQHVGHAVLPHPGTAGGARDHVEQRLRIRTRTDAKRHRLGGHRDMHAGQKLVDHLHRAADARHIAQAPNFARNRVQHRAGTLERLRAAAGHHRHAAGPGAHRAARHRGVQEQPAGVNHARAHAARGLGRHRGAAQHHAAWGDMLQPACREQGLLGLRRVHHEHDQRVQPFWQGRGTIHALPPCGLQFGPGGLPDLAARDAMALLGEVERGAHPHGPQSDHPNLHARVLPAEAAPPSCCKWRWGVSAGRAAPPGSASTAIAVAASGRTPANPHHTPPPPRPRTPRPFPVTPGFAGPNSCARIPVLRPATAKAPEAASRPAPARPGTTWPMPGPPAAQRSRPGIRPSARHSRAARGYGTVAAPSSKRRSETRHWPLQTGQSFGPDG